MTKQNAQKRRGFTLTELAIVLGVMGTILSAIWVASARVSDSNKAQKAAGQVQIILSGYRSLYGSHGIDDPTPWDDVTCLGINAGYFPSDMIPSVACGTVPTGHPITPWGGTSYMTVQVVQSNNQISINYFNISQQACISLSNAVAGSGSTDLLYQCAYNGSWQCGVSLTTTQINTYCSGAAGNGYFVQANFTAR